MYKLIAVFFTVFLFFSCQSTDNKKESEINKQNISWNPPPDGEIIDRYEEKITEDQLNDSKFSVILSSTENSKSGTYQVMISFANNKNVTEIDFPNYQDKFQVEPVLKKGNNKYECLIGFKSADKDFNEFYKVSVINNDIHLEQTKSYYIMQK